MDTLKAVLDEILAARPHAAAGTWLLWTVLGILAGLALAVVLYFALDRAGAWKLEWSHAKWLRVLAVLWLLGSFAVVGSSMGGCEGSLRAARNTLDLAEVRAGVLHSAAAAVSGALAQLDQQLREREGAKPDPALLDRYAKGEAELDVAGFRGRLARAEADLVRSAVGKAKGPVCATLGIAPSGAVDGLLEISLNFLARKALRMAADEGLKKAGLSESADGFFGALDAAASLSGSPGGATHDEVAKLLVEQSFVPLLLLPVRRLVRSAQIGGAFCLAGALAVPLLGFWIGRRVEAGKAGPPAAPPVSFPPTR